MEQTYCARCYIKSHRDMTRFGFCKRCWEKKGKPPVMGSDDYIAEEEPANQ